MDKVTLSRKAQMHKSGLQRNSVTLPERAAGERHDVRRDYGSCQNLHHRSPRNSTSLRNDQVWLLAVNHEYTHIWLGWHNQRQCVNSCVAATQFQSMNTRSSFDLTVTDCRLFELHVVYVGRGEDHVMRNAFLRNPHNDQSTATLDQALWSLQR